MPTPPEIEGLRAPLCVYCGKLTTVAGLGSARHFRCEPCDARCNMTAVGKPIGRVQKSAIRLKRDAAQAAFVRLLIDKELREDISREAAAKAGLAWLGSKLGREIEMDDFSSLSEAECKAVVAICDPAWSVNRKKGRAA